MRRYDSVEEYYAARTDPQARRFSPEVDFGVQWVKSAGETWPNWRVSFVRNAGEVYAVELVKGVVLLIAEGMTEAEVERRMVGWAEESHRPVAWAVDRLRTSYL